MKKYLLILFGALALCGCAGSSLDKDFRSKVSEVDPKVMVSDNGGNITGTAGARIIFRDPGSK